MKKSRVAFTLLELLIACTVCTVVGGILYTLGTEALYAFTRNVSINRGYSEARTAMDRLASYVQAAGHTPVLLNEDGSLWSTSILPSNSTATQQAAGVRFYALGSQPTYPITTCASTASTMAVTVPTGAPSPKVGDVVQIGAVGLQGIISAVSGSGTSVTLTLTDMSGVAQTIGVLCNPDITTSTNITTLQSNCLIYNRVGFIAVSTPALASPSAAPAAGNIVAATSTELRYYPNFNDLTKYKVVAHLIPNKASAEEVYIQRPRPFNLTATPTLTATFCDQVTDYTNRTRDISTANTFARVQSSFGPRSPRILSQGPF